jgi:hypothetical protein
MIKIRQDRSHNNGNSFAVGPCSGFEVDAEILICNHQQSIQRLLQEGKAAIPSTDP